MSRVFSPKRVYSPSELLLLCVRRQWQVVNCQPLFAYITNAPRISSPMPSPIFACLDFDRLLCQFRDLCIIAQHANCFHSRPERNEMIIQQRTHYYSLHRTVKLSTHANQMETFYLFSFSKKERNFPITITCLCSLTSRCRERRVLALVGGLETREATCVCVCACERGRSWCNAIRNVMSKFLFESFTT